MHEIVNIGWRVGIQTEEVGAAGQDLLFFRSENGKTGFREPLTLAFLSDLEGEMGN